MTTSAPQLSEPLSEQPFYFIVVLWGQHFRWLFANLCLPSLLSQRNIPGLGNKRDAKFILFAPGEDFAALDNAPIVSILRKNIDLEYIEIPIPSPGDDKFAVMTRCHKIAADIAMAHRAFAVFLCPDALLSDGTVVALQERARKGAKVVLVSALRHRETALLRELSDLGALRDDRPLTLSSREVMRIALKHLHPQVIAHDWDSECFSVIPGFCVWRVPPSNGLVLHNTRWAPLLFSYRHIAKHDTSSNYGGEGHISIDDDYVYRNYGISDDIHVVTDSDEIAYVSLTPDEVGTPGVTTRSEFSKRVCLRVAAFSGIMDPLQWRLFKLHVRFHDRDIDSAWADREREIDSIISRCIDRPPNQFDRFWQRHGTAGVVALSRRVGMGLVRRLRRSLLGVYN